MKRLVLICALAVLILSCQQDSERLRHEAFFPLSIPRGYLGLEYFCTRVKGKTDKLGLRPPKIITMSYNKSINCGVFGYD